MDDRLSHRRALRAISVALFLSGAAGLVNQIVWQRALKVFLGGSEALSSMTIVVIFMLGLGAGAVLAAGRSDRVRHPILVLALTEIALGGVTLMVRWLLGLDISHSIYGAERLAVAAGVPLRAVYVAASVLLLGVPCGLMGVTVPLSSEAIQRQLGLDDRKVIARIFFVSTGGAVIGALGTGFYLMPYLGQRLSLLVAAAANLAAGALLAALAPVVGPAPVTAPASQLSADRAGLGPILIEDVMGGLLGFFALCYEVFLFRLMALTYAPLPYTFTATLCGFLALWSAGVYLSERGPEAIGASVLVAAALVGIVPRLLDANSFLWQMPGGVALCFLPCLLFGRLYGTMVSRSATRWGRDVGRFSALNTLGSCLGVVLFTLLGYEIDPVSGRSFIAAGLLATFALWNARTSSARPMRRVWALATATMSAAAVVVAMVGWLQPYLRTPRGRIFYGRDGVIEVNGSSVYWDGLWHSALSADRSHLGTSNWLLAVAPLIAHDGPPTDALVIGLGAGITSSTLSEVDQLGTIETYDINQTLRPFLADYGPGTLDVATNPRVRIIWQDGRTGLALHEKKYDLITQQPLYLKQAGSSLLLSREYLKLAQARMKPGAIMAIYSYSEGNEAQALLVRQTATSVFRYCEGFDHGYMVLASDAPIDVSEAAVTRRLGLYPVIKAEIDQLEADSRSSAHPFRFHDMYDAGGLAWTGSPFLITDDAPLVEYPDLTKKLSAAHR